MSVTIHSSEPGPNPELSDPQSPTTTIYKITINDFSYTLNPGSATNYTVHPTGRRGLTAAFKYRIRADQDGTTYTLAKYSRPGLTTLSGKFKVSVTDNVYAITRKYTSGDVAKYEMLKKGNEWEARKLPGQKLYLLPKWSDETDVVEAGRAFDMGLIIWKMREEEKDGEWDMVCGDEGDEEFEMVEKEVV